MPTVFHPPAPIARRPVDSRKRVAILRYASVRSRPVGFDVGTAVLLRRTPPSARLRRLSILVSTDLFERCLRLHPAGSAQLFVVPNSEAEAATQEPLPFLSGTPQASDSSS